MNIFPYLFTFSGFKYILPVIYTKHCTGSIWNVHSVHRSKLFGGIILKYLATVKNVLPNLAVPESESRTSEHLADSLGTLLLVQPENDSLDSGLGGQGGLDEGLLGVPAILCSSVSTGVTSSCPSCTNTGYCMYYVYVPWHERRTC